MKGTTQKLIGLIGIVLAIIAIGLGLYAPTKSLLIGLLSVFALLCLGLFFFSYFEAFREFSKKRSTQLGLNSLLMVVSFIFIVIMINLIVSQYYFRYDLSATRSFTLSPQTENIVKKLDRELRILAFIQMADRPYKRLLALLEGYRYFNHKVTYSIYDLDSVPGIAQRYDVQRYNTTVITDGDRYVRLDGVDEEIITNGIIRIIRKEIKKIYFLQGHGEHSIRDDKKGGIKKAAESLRAMGYKVQALNLTTIEEVPEDASLVIIAGPRITLGNEEIERLRRYAKKGRLLLLLDSDGNRMEEFLNGFALAFYKGLIVDPENNLAGADPTVPVVTEYPSTPITEHFTITTVYPTVMAVIKNSGLEMWYEYVPIVRSSEKSWVETDSLSMPVFNKGKDKKGPQNIAMLVRARKGTGRLVVFGDSDFMTNEYIDISGNGNLFRNVVSYLVGEEDLVNIEPQKTEYVPLYITDTQAKQIMYLFVVGLPLVIGLSGIVVWLKRRRL